MRLSGVLIRPSEPIFHQKNPMGALDLKNMPSTAIYNTPRGEALRDEPTETTTPPPPQPPKKRTTDAWPYKVSPNKFHFLTLGSPRQREGNCEYADSSNFSPAIIYVISWRHLQIKQQSCARYISAVTYVDQNNLYWKGFCLQQARIIFDSQRPDSYFLTQPLA